MLTTRQAECPDASVTVNWRYSEIYHDVCNIDHPEELNDITLSQLMWTDYIVK